MMLRTRALLALVLCLAGGALATILLSTHYGVPLLGEAAMAACGAGEGCDVVSQSRYAHFLGLPLAAWGLFFYGAIAALLAPAVAGREEDHREAPAFAFALVVLAIAIDAILLGLQLAVIKAMCKFCVATYVVNLLLLAVLWPLRGSARAINFFVNPARRSDLIGWMVSAVFMFGLATAGNAALKERKTLASASILGAPMAPVAAATPEPVTPTAVPAAPGSLEAELAAARAEAKKWKQTLDDDLLLQNYRNQKARDDFNKTPVTNLDLASAPQSGPKDAPIHVAVFSDFMCPFCRDLAAGLKNFLPTTGNQVQTHYKQFPLDLECNPRIGRTVHPGACLISRASICAQDSGRFWEFHDKVFARTWDRASRQEVIDIAVSAGVDAARLNACIDSAATRGRLSRDIEEGFKAGVGSTPTVFINGRKLPTTAVFLLGIEEERKRLNLQVPKP